jgi:spoIIIJ-associated protein
MSEKHASLEVIAPSVEEAVAKGLDDLGLVEDDVEVDVLDSGSRGLFGLGSRQARVRLTMKSVVPDEVGEMEAPVKEALPIVAQARPVEPLPVEMETLEGGEEDYTLQVASDTVRDLLEKMKVRAKVNAYYGQADDIHSKIPVRVDVHGSDLSILIGPRAETLNALQYIAGLIVGKELGHTIPLVVDVEGYRTRREQQLRQLARRMADQAIKTGHRQVLEPMPANERRLIHIELRSNLQVTTESIGEEPRRKVTIVPKNRVEPN